MFEKNTLAICDYLLPGPGGPTISNLSPVLYVTSAVSTATIIRRSGRGHVVAEMKRSKAVIGGEGNADGLPDLHYGRDSLVGVACAFPFGKEWQDAEQPKASYPAYQMIKEKIQLDPAMDVDGC